MMEYSICLAIDSQDRWVVIEIKAGALGSARAVDRRSTTPSSLVASRGG